MYIVTRKDTIIDVELKIRIVFILSVVIHAIKLVWRDTYYMNGDSITLWNTTCASFDLKKPYLRFEPNNCR